MTLTPSKTTVTFGTLRAPVLRMPTPAQPRIPTPAERLSAHRMVQRIGNGAAEIFMAPTFIMPAGCRALCDLIESKRRPSTLADPNGDQTFRTSETCDMDASIGVVNDVRTAICTLLGIDQRFAEPLQGQRYSPGQQFKRHGDYFRVGSDDYEKYCAVSGQRTWTAMAYLDEPEAGGHTVFSDLDIDMKPTTGTLLMWNNLLPDGTPNMATMHQATPVEIGVKRIITLWFRQRPWG